MAPGIVLRWLYAAIVAAVLLLLGISTTALYRSWTRYQTQAQTEVTNLAMVLDKAVTGMLSKVDLSLTTLAGEYAGGRPPESFQVFLENQARLLPEVISLRVLDPSGRVIHAAKGLGPQETNPKVMASLEVLESDPGAGLIITEPYQGRESNRWVVVLMRGLRHPDGSFAGAVLAVLPVEHFTALFASLDLGEHGFAALRNQDQGILAHYPDAGPLGAVSQGPGPGAVGAKAGLSGVSEGVSLLNGQKHMVLSRNIPGTGLYLSLGLAEADYLAHWWIELGRLATLNGLFILAMAYLAWRLRRGVLAHEQAVDQLGRYRQLVQSSGEMMCVVGLDYVYTTVNQAFLKFHGLSPGAVIGRHMAEVVGRDNFEKRVKPALDRSLRGETVHGEAWMNLAGKKGPVYVSATISPMRDVNQAITGVVSNLIDNTKAKEYEDGLRQAKYRAESATLAKSEFLANMSHEIRTPLGGVLGMLQLLEGEELTPDQRKCVTMADQAGRGLLTILNDILDLSKIEAGRMEVFEEAYSPRDLAASVCAMFSPLGAQKGLHLACRVEESLPRSVLGDFPRLRQILFNLLGNAVKFTREGGVNLEIYQEKDQLCFQVGDTGIGIAPGMLSAIFQPFTQADGSISRLHQGTGLGLTIVKRLAQLMGGSVDLKSAPGQGTTVTLTVPLKPAEAAPGQPDPFGEACPLKSRILLVEDDEVSRLAARHILEKKGQSVVCAQNGREALGAMRTQDFDVVLMDIQMPVMDGMEAVRRIRAGEAGKGRISLPVVALTAHAMKGDEETLLGAGFDAYLRKPLEADRLLSVLAKLLKG